MKRKNEEYLVLASAALIILLVVVSVGFYLYVNLDEDYRPPSSNPPSKTFKEVKQFESEEEFKEILESYEDNVQYRNDDLSFSPMLDMIGEAAPESGSKSFAEPYRYSGTNVQVLTIDEADIVKTDGQYIYYSSDSWGHFEEMPVEILDDVSSDIAEPYYRSEGYTNIISAFPVEDLNLEGVISKGGELYIVDDTLIVESYNEYTSFDVEDPTEPEKLWKYDLEENTGVVTSRLFNDNLYVVTQNWVYPETPCVIPFIGIEGGRTEEILCTDIYHTGQPDNSVYTIIRIEPKTGTILDKFSFLGSPYQTLIYMSEKNLYLTYADDADEFMIMYDFIMENEDLFSSTYIQKVENLKDYEITTSSKLNELQILTSDYIQGLSSVDRLETQTRLTNRFNEYSEEHIRDFSGTGIIKVDLVSLDLVATGKVQGKPPDQFALDEYNGNLRVATNVEPYQTYFFSGYFGDDNWEIIRDIAVIEAPQTDQQNDIVVFDDKLDVIGEVRGLGLTEDIYSSRFIGDAAYVVTFRQIDPFYVVDLSDPTDPIVKGELKIPGYSSYLHPISNNLILGIGQEDWRVKVSLFDVSDPTNPQELSKYSLGSGWSEVESNHHAFLHDQKHQVFFIPTGNGGHVMTYSGNKLDLVRSIEGYNVQRALYINDFMYILATDRVVVYDENTWDKVKELYLESASDYYGDDGRSVPPNPGPLFD